MNAKSNVGWLWAIGSLLACAAPAKLHAQPLRDSLAGYELQVLVDGEEAPRFFHAGESYLLGQRGQRYTLRVWNRTPRRVEAVVSVDGRDVVDGRPGDFRNKRGYLVPAHGFVDIDGWRLSEREAAAFRFTTVADSYAARVGSPRHVGVIGVAVFPERIAYRPRPSLPWPGDHRSDNGRGAGAAREAESSGAAPAAPSAAPSAEAKAAPRRREGLGTQFGEAVDSRIEEVFFVRADSAHPSAILGLRYDDRRGLLARGIDVDRYLGVGDEGYLRGTAQPFPVSHRPYARPPGGWSR